MTVNTYIFIKRLHRYILAIGEFRVPVAVRDGFSSASHGNAFSDSWEGAGASKKRIVHRRTPSYESAAGGKLLAIGSLQTYLQELLMWRLHYFAESVSG